jgi:CHAT domain-containing protein
VDGDITLTGFGNGTGVGNTGIQLDVGSAVDSTGTGNVTLTGTGANGAAGINLLPNAAINPTGTGSGAATLTADEIDLSSIAQVRGNGTLQLQPLTPSLGITIGGTTNDNRLNLETSELIAFQDGFSQILIGRDSSSGTIALTGDALFNDPVTLQSDSINHTGGTLAGVDDAAIALLTNGDITTGEIITSGQGITLTSSNGAIDTTAGSLVAGSLTGDGGAISLTAAGDIETGQINTTAQNQGGDVSITSRGGAISITNTLLANGNTSNGGDVTLAAAGNIDTGNIVASSFTGNGGNIRLESGGDINTTVGSTVGSVVANASTGNGGEVTLNAADRITTAAINTLSQFANGGTIRLSAGADIQVATLDAQGGTDGAAATGGGGNVEITTDRFFRASGSFADANLTSASISTGGTSASGSIIIRHGGAGITPFTVGDAGTNGTAAAITTGNIAAEQTISPTQAFLFTHTQDGIQIISEDEPPSPPEPGLGSDRQVDPSDDPFQDLAALSADLIGAQLSVNREGEIIYDVALEIPDEQTLETELERPSVPFNLLRTDLVQAIPEIDEVFESEYEDYLGENIADEQVSVATIRNMLNTIHEETGTNPVIIYALSFPEQLELVLVRPEGPPIRETVPQANARALQKTLFEFRQTVTDIGNSRGYLEPAEQLYNWLIAPLESYLDALDTDTLIFSMSGGLRLAPIAALYDGEQFLVETYALGLIPSVSLTDSRYQSVRNAKVLAMGASEFPELPSLPAVPVELDVVTQQLGSGESFLNEEFTLENLRDRQRRNPHPIVHLATHADFKPGSARDSYIRLWDTKLQIDQMRQLGWYELPQVELLTLSACRTAVGDTDVELGFAGLAVQAGVKSALASLWYVSDEATLPLMGEFYRQLTLPEITIKAEALRQAQLALLRGQVYLDNGELRGIPQLEGTSLPPALARAGKQEFTHPYYWSGFTMIGSPW